MKLTCVIIDDEPDAQEILRLHSNRCGFVTIKGICSNAMEAFHLLNEIEVDFIFLDIEMPEIDGFALMRLLRDTTKVIFTTAYSKYAIEGFEFHVVDYLLKPITFERFLKAVNKLVPKLLRFFVPEKIKLSAANEIVYPNDIIFVESVGNYVKVIFEASSILIYSTLKDTWGLLEPYGFIRCHRRYIVNRTLVAKVEKDRLILSNQKEIPVGISYRQQVKLLLK